MDSDRSYLLFWKKFANFEIVVCCKLHVALYGLNIFERLFMISHRNGAMFSHETSHDMPKIADAKD